MGRQAEQDAVSGALISSTSGNRKGPPGAGLSASGCFTFLQAKKRGGITRPLFLPFFIILMNRILRWVLTDILTGLRLSVYAGVILPACRNAATGTLPRIHHRQCPIIEIKCLQNNKIRKIDVKAGDTSS
ncbi:hypothetical protein [Pseudomonas denitrificans (nom. rej.)]|uniref:hypothetical protein n=1 Tax=Pseudomonas denitrificans TaxID=43306 RepID=UPI00142E954C|nr:hypothetical protein [Pseudomonas denitrificans (nom. rej.)]